jgi:misacylated tRNA(Ala) deacylase
VTDQRYLTDDTVATFEATVERTLDDRLVLDGTHFYPTGGGQPHDTGTLVVADDPDRRFRVVDVEKQDAVYHTVEPAGGDADATAADPDDTSTLPAPGTAVVGTIDWERRRAHSRYHTAQHLLSAALLESFDAPTTGNALYADHAHLDAAYEARLNELVDADLPVERYTLDRAAAETTLDTERTRIHLLPDSITELRIVEIGGTGGTEPYDRTACAGTHVETTGEIGEVVVTGRETKGSDEERIRFALTAHRKAP